MLFLLGLLFISCHYEAFWCPGHRPHTLLPSTLFRSVWWKVEEDLGSYKILGEGERLIENKAHRIHEEFHLTQSLTLAYSSQLFSLQAEKSGGVSFLCRILKLNLLMHILLLHLTEVWFSPPVSCCSQACLKSHQACPAEVQGLGSCCICTGLFNQRNRLQLGDSSWISQLHFFPPRFFDLIMGTPLDLRIQWLKIIKNNTNQQVLRVYYAPALFGCFLYVCDSLNPVTTPWGEICLHFTEAEMQEWGGQGTWSGPLRL